MAALGWHTDSRIENLGCREHDLNRGRPRRAAPTVRSESLIYFTFQNSAASANEIKLHHEPRSICRHVVQLAASILIICDYDFSQRAPAVLDSTGNGQAALASTRWHAGSLEHVHVVFSDAAVGGLFARAGYNFADRSSQAGSSA